jgi:hypothetical protein
VCATGQISAWYLELGWTTSYVIHLMYTVYVHIYLFIYILHHVQGDQKVSVHLMITVQQEKMF